MEKPQTHCNGCVFFLCKMIEQIKQRINEKGLATRADIVEALRFFDDVENAYTNIKTMLDDTTLTAEVKEKILDDLLSYE